MDATPFSSAPSLPRTNAAAPLLLVAALVVYGSLIPLDFVPLGLDAALQRFAQTPWLELGADKRADWVANGLAYAPIGLLAALALLPQQPGWLARALGAVAAALGCALLAVGVEFVQLYFPQRTVSLNDIVAEVLGGALGAVVGATVAVRWWPRQGWWQRVARQPSPLALAYGAALAAVAVFPFDLMISAAEWQAKLAGPTVGWLVAPDTAVMGRATLLGRLLLEITAAMPLAVALRSSSHINLGAALLRAALTGAAFGAVLELLQLAMVSTHAQGVSVLTRAAGLAAGLLLLRGLQHLPVQAVRRGVRQAAWVALPLHLAAVAWLSGWGHAPWKSPEQAWQVLSTQVRFLPFYYHYFVTELEAVVSAVRVMALYAPVGLWVWALRGGKGDAAARQAKAGTNTSTSTGALPAAVAGAALCATAEAGRLMAGLRPDPTNLLIAATTAAAVAALLHVFTRWRAAPQGTEGLVKVDAAEASAPAVAGLASRSGSTSWAPGASLALLGLLWAASSPWGWPVLTPALMAAGAVLVAWRPLWLPGVVAAAALLVDPRPWAGPAVVGEFDVLLAALLAAAVWRTRRLPGSEPAPKDTALAVVLGLLTLSAALAVAPTVGHWASTGLPLATEPLGPLRGLEAAKGVWWGVALVAWARWGVAPAKAAALARSLPVGIAVGMVGTAAAMTWEWLALGGGLNLDNPLRLSGPLADMANGGNSTEALLAIGLAVCAATALQPGTRALLRALMGVAALAAAWGLLLSYSRAAHLALAVMLGVGMVLVVTQRWQRGSEVQGNPGVGALRGALAALGALVLAGAAWVGITVVAGPGAQQRLQNIGQEAQERLLTPWKAFALHDGSVYSTLFGMGWSAYPAVRYGSALPEERVMMSGVSTAGPRVPGQVSITLAPGDAGSLNQLLRTGGSTPVALDVEVRWQLQGQPAAPTPTVWKIAVCRKWLLNSDGCVDHTLTAATAERQTARFQLDLARLQRQPGQPALPMMVALHHGGGAVVQLSQLRVRDALTGQVLAGNTPDSPAPRGWLAMSDAHRAWKIESIYAAIPWERGAIGVVAVLVFGALAWRRARTAGGFTSTALMLMGAGLGVMGLWDAWVGSGRVELLVLLVATLSLVGTRQPLK